MSRTGGLRRVRREVIGTAPAHYNIMHGIVNARYYGASGAPTAGGVQRRHQVRRAQRALGEPEAIEVRHQLVAQKTRLRVRGTVRLVRPRAALRRAQRVLPVLSPAHAGVILWTILLSRTWAWSGGVWHTRSLALALSPSNSTRSPWCRIFGASRVCIGAPSTYYF